MKIALLTSEFPPFHGGIGSYAREMASAAAAAGHEVVVLAPDYGKDCTAVDAEFDFRVVRFAGGPASFKGLPKRIQETRRLLKGEAFDLIHAVDWPFFIPARLSARRKAMTILTVHGTEINYMSAPRRRMALKAIGFWRSGWARWTANSQFTADLLLRKFPHIDARSVRGIPLGVGDVWKSGRLDKRTTRTALGIADDRLILVSLGRVVPRKGHMIVATALAALPEAVSSRIEWWVIGPLQEADYADALREAVKDLKAKACFFGALPDEDVRARLSAADLFCLPGYQDLQGRFEGFGLAFLEAGAYGLPAIATRSGGIPEAVDDGVTGILVKERDSQAVGEAIETFVSKPDLLAKMSMAAEEKANHATWAKVAAESYN
ncbi:MAG: glycosyltransferase family 4 protein [Sphingomonas sp.]